MRSPLSAAPRRGPLLGNLGALFPGVCVAAKHIIAVAIPLQTQGLTSLGAGEVDHDQSPLLLPLGPAAVALLCHVNHAVQTHQASVTSR